MNVQKGRNDITSVIWSDSNAKSEDKACTKLHIIRSLSSLQVDCREHDGTIIESNE